MSNLLKLKMRIVRFEIVNFKNTNYESCLIFFWNSEIFNFTKTILHFYKICKNCKINDFCIFNKNVKIMSKS